MLFFRYCKYTGLFFLNKLPVIAKMKKSGANLSALWVKTRYGFRLHDSLKEHSGSAMQTPFSFEYWILGGVAPYVDGLIEGLCSRAKPRVNFSDTSMPISRLVLPPSKSRPKNACGSCISTIRFGFANERKARIPFGNLDFMRYVIAIAPPPKSKAYTRTASTLSVWPFRTGTGFRMISSRGKRLPFVIMLDD